MKTHNVIRAMFLSIGALMSGLHIDVVSVILAKSRYKVMPDKH
jgi:hypothetical protein